MYNHNKAQQSKNRVGYFLGYIVFGIISMAKYKTDVTPVR